jgi:non-heme chloroperoxidase
MPFISAADGTQLYWQEWGQGSPLLFLNGLGCACGMWDYQVAALAEYGYRCITFDRRGHGRSDRPGHGYHFDSFADDVAALIEALDLSELTLVTHSMGGGEAIRYVSRHGSARIARMVLLATTTPKLLQTEDNPGGAPQEAFEALWAQWKRDYPQWVAEATPPFFVPETSRAMMGWIGTLLQAPVPIALACSRALVAEDFRAEMRRLEVPTLIVHGDRDRSALLELTAEPSARLMPNCRLLVYPGAPHGLMYTHMDRLHGDLLEFMRESAAFGLSRRAMGTLAGGTGQPRGACAT